MVHAKKSSNFTSNVIAIVFWNALCDAIGRDFSKKVIAILFWMEFPAILAILGNPRRSSSRSDRHFSLVGPVCDECGCWKLCYSVSEIQSVVPAGEMYRFPPATQRYVLFSCK